jgi:hypothetical protein
MTFRAFLLPLLAFAVTAHAGVEVDIDKFGQSLGGWNAKRGKASEYEISGATYRTYRPEISPSPDGGIYVSVRIDHLRGLFASDDHASLEMSFNAEGQLVTAQSSLALQGRTIASELIRGGASASNSVAAPYIEHAVKVGTDLVADLSSKLLREKIVEPGRVSFPAAIRHNYNQLFQAVKKLRAKARAASATKKSTPPTPQPPAPLPDVRPYQPSNGPQTPLPPQQPGAPANPATPAPSTPAQPAPEGPPAPPR